MSATTPVNHSNDKIQKKSKAQARRERKKRTLAKFNQSEEKNNSSENEDIKEGEKTSASNDLYTNNEVLAAEESKPENVLNGIDGVFDDSIQVTWPDLESVPRHLRKYWFQRYSLFHKFDQGIKMDEVGWFSVTPEVIANSAATRFVNAGVTSVCDGFCGVGGNAIAFARQGLHVIAIELDKTRLECAKNNARIYAVEHLITFIHGDFMTLKNIKADSVFLSPPWGGIDYINDKIFDIESMPINGIHLFNRAKEISANICYFLPRNVNKNQLIQLAAHDRDGGGRVELEKVFLDDRIKCWNALYGPALGP